MPTFNKPPDSAYLLDEAVESFLKQDYPYKELIILNDCAQQQLVFEHEDVVVANMPRRFRTLGEKLNAAIALSSGELLCRWDDDDISLPWRLAYSVLNLFDNDPRRACWSPSGYWFSANPSTPLKYLPSRLQAQGIFKRSIHVAIRGFTFMNSGQDSDYESRIDDSILGDDGIEPAFMYYIYRWGTGSQHLSGYGMGRDKNGKDGYDKIGEKKISGGTYTIAPHWRADYVKQAREATNAQETNDLKS